MSPQWAVRARTVIWFGFFIFLVGTVNGVLCGQEDEAEERTEPQKRLVLLKSGRMMTGFVSRNAGGYLIEEPNGRIQVPIEEVKFVVKDLHEAYLKQRDSIVEPTPATHLALATWCTTNNLYEDARQELKRCLTTDPDNAEARRLLQRLTDTIRADRLPQLSEPVARKTFEGFRAPEVESLGGLSHESAVLFTSRIQHLLLNKCGNASCHGSASSNEFKITSARGGSRNARQTSERNLAETLRYIDFDDVAKSRLLEALKGSHGGKGSIFVGQAAQDQIKTIRNWVKTVAEEKRAEAEELENRPTVTSKTRSKKRVTQASAKSDPKSTASRADTSRTESSTKVVLAVEQVEFADDSPKAEPKKVNRFDALELANEPEDAFDPEVFNRLSNTRKTTAVKD